MPVPTRRRASAYDASPHCTAAAAAAAAVLVQYKQATMHMPTLSRRTRDVNAFPTGEHEQHCLPVLVFLILLLLLAGLARLFG
jgi:hypothetical protein